MKFQVKLLFFVISLIAAACAQGPKGAESKLYEPNVLVGKTVKAGKYSNIYFSGQPKSEDWVALKDQGFTHVINFRQTKEYDEKLESKQVKASGMIYTHLPMDGKAPLTKDKVDLVTKAVMAHRKKGKTLIHCGSGNRVAYWSGAHFYLDHKYSKEKSMNLAKDMGLTSEKLQNKLTEFMKSNTPD